MTKFKLEYNWMEPEFKDALDEIRDQILDRHRLNPISTGDVAKWCKVNNFPKRFCNPVVIRQIVSHLRRTEGAFIGTCESGTYGITDIEGWNKTRKFVEKKLRILQATHSALITSEIRWYRQRGMKKKHDSQLEIPL